MEVVLVERIEDVSEEVLEDLWRREESLEGIVVVVRGEVMERRILISPLCFFLAKKLD